MRADAGRASSKSQMGDPEQSVEELQASETAGYKVGEKKTIEELAKLDEADGTLYTLSTVDTPLSSYSLSLHSITCEISLGFFIFCRFM
jgi:hypothetical protein